MRKRCGPSGCIHTSHRTACRPAVKTHCRKAVWVDSGCPVLPDGFAVYNSTASMPAARRAAWPFLLQNPLSPLRSVHPGRLCRGRRKGGHARLCLLHSQRLRISSSTEDSTRRLTRPYLHTDDSTAATSSHDRIAPAIPAVVAPSDGGRRLRCERRRRSHRHSAAPVLRVIESCASGACTRVRHSVFGEDEKE